MRIAVLALGLLVAGCDALPRDTADTSPRIAAARVMRVGVAGPLDPAGRRFLAAVVRDTGARAAVQAGSLEPLLLKLEEGELDLVVAAFAPDSGWRTRVSLTPPLDGTKEGDRPLAPHAAARNGEHRWVMRLERLARAAAHKGPTG